VIIDPGGVPSDGDATLVWRMASLGFFAFVVAMVAVQGGRGRPVGRITAGAAVGCGLALLAGLDQPAVLTDWVWPPLLLLIAYWTSGLLFVAPSAAQERALGVWDARLGLRHLSSTLPRPVVELLECAYAGVYLLVPLALVLQPYFVPEASVGRLWAVILITDFICFGGMAWVHTRPPRALEEGEPWASTVRRFNLRLLGSASVQVNTFPSGHAAEALAAFLLVRDAPWFVAGPMFAAAMAVSAGAVLGRYHYLADIVAGWIVALAVVLVLSA
jgi:membrane-associated phospholipid phosphatase